LVTAILAFLIGVTLGFAAAIMGGLVDTLLARAVDVLMAIPVLISALMVLSVMGTSIPAMVLTIAVMESTRVFRLARAVAMGIVVLDFVSIARLRGERLAWILGREGLPNAVPPLVVEVGLRFFFI